jgi:hypothetical protein
LQFSLTFLDSEIMHRTLSVLLWNWNVFFLKMHVPILKIKGCLAVFLDSTLPLATYTHSLLPLGCWLKL